MRGERSSTTPSPPAERARRRARARRLATPCTRSYDRSRSRSFCCGFACASPAPSTFRATVRRSPLPRPILRRLRPLARSCTRPGSSWCSPREPESKRPHWARSPRRRQARARDGHADHHRCDHLHLAPGRGALPKLKRVQLAFLHGVAPKNVEGREEVSELIDEVVRGARAPAARRADCPVRDAGPRGWAGARCMPTCP